MVLRKIFGHKMEKLTGCCRTFQYITENEILGACEGFGRNYIIQKVLCENLKAVCCQRIKE
jgi:hypothetical protein